MKDRTMMKSEKEKEENNLFHYSVDRTYRMGNHLMVDGWAVSVEEGDYSIEVTDEKGNVIDSIFDHNPREDVCKLFGLSLSENVNVGFHIMIPAEKIKTDYICVCLSDKKYENKETIFVREILDDGEDVLKNATVDYDEWIRKRLATPEQLEEQRKVKFSYEPLISIIVPLFNTPFVYLEEMIESVLQQTYSNVELCMADGSTNDKAMEFIQNKYAGETRIRYERLKENRGISENTNEALKLAQGDFILLLDHDDVLTLNACFEMVKALNEDPNIDVIYTDEDKVSKEGDFYFFPHFKPDFNLDFLRSNNYICHIFVVKATIVKEVGSFRGEFDGAQDYDFVLRCCEKAKKIHHIPKILYHWRAHPGSTSENPESKMYAFEAGAKAIAGHFERLHIPAEVEQLAELGRYYSKLLPEGNPKISILIVDKGTKEELSACLESIYKNTVYTNFEVLIMPLNPMEGVHLNRNDILKKYENIKYIKGFTKIISKRAMTAAKRASGEYLVFLHSDVKIISKNWLNDMLGYCQRADVGAVGAKLIDDENKISHAGIIIGLQGLYGKWFVNYPDDIPSYVGKAHSIQNISAVSPACMMTKKKTFIEMHGFQKSYPWEMGGVDYCLRLSEQGKLTVMNPFVKLNCNEKQHSKKDENYMTGAQYKKAEESFYKRWEKLYEDGDPYYNANLDLQKPYCGLRRDNQSFPS